MQPISPDFWRGKRVFLTGHTGFKGSWLSIWLKSMGVELYGLALPPPTKPALFSEANIELGMTSTIGDIRDYDIVLAAVDDCKPEIIIHMAAQPLVRPSYQAPIETYATNVMGTIHVFEAARNVGTAKAIVNVTTDKCYENREWVWGYREDEPMGGYDPYSNSKGCSELVTSAYRRSFFQQSRVALASARAGNVIGGGDWATDRLVPDILKAFESKKSVTIRNAHATRPWQHVLEPLSGYLLLAEHLYNDGQCFAEGWNFGPSEEDSRSVQWIVEHMAKEWGKGANWQLDSGKHPHEANHLKLDISKARFKLGWSPRWSLATAIEKIIDWHNTWLAKADVQAKCLQQIAEYQRTAI
ncbi:CDP-glucose 4,6-dehydratase [Zooshikella harenae]|uniref:CDP-glucose 4,6-dehydratase n=1 Tax=Zooshikella harenae TaxID=2827238 RepID=A0ABS5ZAT3_9GAMM|nr:CDP-glucose 4,6-dehydratase [Zooshikella harenae]MBU2710370.1 CDP-glucose 4,6-dehydratase [Zooshikella harenae]